MLTANEILAKPLGSVIQSSMNPQHPLQAMKINPQGASKLYNVVPPSDVNVGL
jgi:hypothetical protein